MKVKLKSGKEVTLKDVSVDDKDEMLDSCEWNYDKDGNPSGMVNMNKTTTMWIRKGLEGDTSDKVLKTFSMEDRTEIFIALQKYLTVGEEKASK